VRSPKSATGGRRWPTFHDLRHYYASLLIRHNESVKVVQARLGHASAAETLDTYSHLWPDSEDRTRIAVDEVLGAGSAADSVRTAGAQ
jgi:integrase